MSSKQNRPSYGQTALSQLTANKLSHSQNHEKQHMTTENMQNIDANTFPTQSHKTREKEEFSYPHKTSSIQQQNLNQDQNEIQQQNFMEKGDIDNAENTVNQLSIKDPITEQLQLTQNSEKTNENEDKHETNQGEENKEHPMDDRLPGKT